MPAQRQAVVRLPAFESAGAGVMRSIRMQAVYRVCFKLVMQAMRWDCVYGVRLLIAIAGKMFDCYTKVRWDQVRMTFVG